MGENAEYAETVHPFSNSFALSLFFAILYFIAKGRGKREIREKHISLFAAFRSFAFFRNPLFYRERMRNTRNSRKPYVHFRSLSRFRFFSQSYIYRERTRKTRNTRKPYVHFRSPFVLSLFFAILYFIAKERGKRENHMSIFAVLSRFRFFSQSFILSRKDAEYAEYAKTICPFSQSFVLSHYFAILYFIANGCGIREIHGNLGIYLGATIEHHLSF